MAAVCARGGDDTVRGDGDDRLRGALGDDLLHGGTGNDVGLDDGEVTIVLDCE